MILYDRITLDDGAKVRITGNGYLVAMPRIARANNIQLYSGDEVGRPDLKMVRVFRPEAEVFHKDALHSYGHQPFTNDHPPEPVTADNWKKYAIGDMGEDVLRDGEFVRVPTVMMDKAAINDYRSGKRELSLGYTCDLKWEAGTAPNGEAYDAIQTNIRANHLALVKTARGGADLRIGDQQTGDQDTMTTQTIPLVIDGATLQVDAVAASVINAAFQRLTSDRDTLKTSVADLQGKLASAQTDAATAAATHTKAIETKDAEIAALKQKVTDATVTPEKIQQIAMDYANAIGKARVVLGDKLVIDGKTDVQIMKQVVDAKMGDAAKGYNDDQVRAAFAAFTSDIKVGDKGTGGPTLNDLRQSFGPGTGGGGDDSTTRDKAYADNLAFLGDAWKGNAATKQ